MSCTYSYSPGSACSSDCLQAIDNNAIEESSHGYTECPSSETQKLPISEKEWELAPQLSHAWNCLSVNQGSVSSSLLSNQNSKCRSEEAISHQELFQL